MFQTRSQDYLSRIEKDQKIMASIMGNKFKKSLLNDSGDIFGR